MRDLVTAASFGRATRAAAFAAAVAGHAAALVSTTHQVFERRPVQVPCERVGGCGIVTHVTLLHTHQSTHSHTTVTHALVRKLRVNCM